MNKKEMYMLFEYLNRTLADLQNDVQCHFDYIRTTKPDYYSLFETARSIDRLMFFKEFYSAVIGIIKLYNKDVFDDENM